MGSNYEHFTCHAKELSDVLSKVNGENISMYCNLLLYITCSLCELFSFEANEILKEDETFVFVRLI